MTDPARHDRWLREFHLNGFVALGDFLPADLVRAMHDQLLPLVRGEYEGIQREGLDRLRSPGRLPSTSGATQICWAGLWRILVIVTTRSWRISRRRSSGPGGPGAAAGARWNAPFPAATT